MAGRLDPLRTPGALGGLQQLTQGLLDATQHVDVRSLVVVAGDAERQPAVVGEDRHTDPDVPSSGT